MDHLIAADFLTGSILTLVLPVALVVAVGIWWTAILRRRS
jgi:hypothetical protein